MQSRGPDTDMGRRNVANDTAQKGRKMSNRLSLTRLAPIWASAFALLVSGPSANAALITSLADLADPTTITFAPFGGAGNRVNGVGPVQVGAEVGEDVVFTSTSGSSFVGDTVGYSLGGNGTWTTAFGPFTGSNADPVSMTYVFNDGPVNGVGGFLNYVPGQGAVIIEVLDSLSNVLESFDLTTAPGGAISTPGAINDGAFRGMLRVSNDIHAFRVRDNFIVLDDLSFSRAVPGPGTLTLIILGLTGAGLARRRKHRG